MKSLFRQIKTNPMTSLFVLITLLGLIFFGGQVVAQGPYPNLLRGNTLVSKGYVRVEGVGIQTASIGYVSATAIYVGAPAAPTACVGLTAGSAELGGTEGYVTVDDDEDFLRFTWQLPETFIDTGVAGELTFEFDIHEQAAEECNIDIRIFEYGNTAVIYTDTLTVANGAARAWVALDTDTLGSDADIGPGDSLLVEITSTTDNDDFNIYGVRCKYRFGLQKDADES